MNLGKWVASKEAAPAPNRQSTALDDLEGRCRHIKHLPTFADERILHWEIVMSTLALPRQPMIDSGVGTSGYRTIVPLLTGRFTQGARLFRNAIRKRRRARTAAGLVDLRLQCFKPRKRRTNPDSFCSRVRSVQSGVKVPTGFSRIAITRLNTPLLPPPSADGHLPVCAIMPFLVK